MDDWIDGWASESVGMHGWHAWGTFYFLLLFDSLFVHLLFGSDPRRGVGRVGLGSVTARAGVFFELEVYLWIISALRIV
jgi:hypothetical protein